jgi:hypothetical protein
MTDHAKIRLSRLREIGWSVWDPIGLSDMGAAEDAPDEYDGYLLKVAGMLRRGEPVENAVLYLVWAETVNMGLAETSQTRKRPKQL